MFAGEVAAQQPVANAADQPLDVDQETAGKAMMNIWLHTVGPDRQIPRPEAFYSQIVDLLWTSDLYSVADLGAVKDPVPIGGNSPGQRDFIYAAWYAAGGRPPAAPATRAVVDPFTMPEFDESSFSHAQMLRTFAQFELLSQQKIEAAKVVPTLDYDKALNAIGLGKMPFECKPCPNATAKLHTMAEKLKKTQKTPFVCAALRSFLPGLARQRGVREDDEEEESESMKAMQKMMGVKKAKLNLSFLQCLQALDSYALAGAMVEQFSLAAGLAYVRIIKQVGAKAVEDGKWHSVAVIYDELARKKWADRAQMAGLGGSFDLEEQMMSIDDKVYKEALGSSKTAAAEKDTVAASGSGYQRTWGARTAGASRNTICHYCDQPGHVKIDCYKYKADQSKGGQKRFADAYSADAAKGRKHFKR